jgi:hypothetical protein
VKSIFCSRYLAQSTFLFLDALVQSTFLRCLVLVIVIATSHNAIVIIYNTMMVNASNSYVTLHNDIKITICEKIKIT